jgi:hypothetical protein
VALEMTPSTLLSEPSNNGATNTPMTADHQTARPPQLAASNYAGETFWVPGKLQALSLARESSMEPTSIGARVETV